MFIFTYILLYKLYFCVIWFDFTLDPIKFLQKGTYALLMLTLGLLCFDCSQFTHIIQGYFISNLSVWLSTCDGALKTMAE